MTTFKHFSERARKTAAESRVELVTAAEFKGWMTELGIKGDLSDQARETAREIKRAKRQKTSASASDANLASDDDLASDGDADDSSG